MVTYRNPARAPRACVSASRRAPRRPSGARQRALATSARTKRTKRGRTGTPRRVSSPARSRRRRAGWRRVAPRRPALSGRLLRAREIRIGGLLRLGQRLGEREPHRGGACDAWVSLDLFEVDPLGRAARVPRSRALPSVAAAGVERDATRSQNAAKRKSSSGRGSYPASNATSLQRKSSPLGSAVSGGIREPHVRHRRQHGGSVRGPPPRRASRKSLPTSRATSVRRRGVGGGDVGVRARLRETRRAPPRRHRRERHRRVCVYALYASLFRTGDNWCRFFRLFNRASRVTFAVRRSSKGALRVVEKNTLRRRRRGRAPPP